MYVELWNVKVPGTCGDERGKGKERQRKKGKP